MLLCRWLGSRVQEIHVPVLRLHDGNSWGDVPVMAAGGRGDGEEAGVDSHVGQWPVEPEVSPEQ